jgi:hypothetical protein
VPREWIIRERRGTGVGAAVSGVANETDGEVDALLAPPPLLFDPHLVEQSLQLRLQVGRRLGLRVLCFCLLRVHPP